MFEGNGGSGLNASHRIIQINNPINIVCRIEFGIRCVCTETHLEIRDVFDVKFCFFFVINFILNAFIFVSFNHLNM